MLFVLSASAVAVAVTNDRAAKSAKRSADVANQFDVAFDAVRVEEDAADDVITADDAESRRAFAAADVIAHRSILALQQMDAISNATRDENNLVALHTGYGRAVEEMFERFAGGPVTEAEAFEEARVDPYFDPLTDALNQGRKDSDGAAHAELVSLGRSQRLLLFATPLVFGASLALITIFVVKLGRSRRELAWQAEESSYRSLHDGLTGLPNRTLFQRSSEVAVAGAANTGTQMALMVIDLDRFKDINDTMGHHTGDLVLEAVSRRLRGAVRSTDTVARLGGDEFAILLPHVDDGAAALQVATKVQLALVESIDAGSVALDIDASIGIALSGEHGGDVATLLQQADIAMYRAKGRDNGICLYDGAQDDNGAERLDVLGELRRALDHAS